MLEFQQKLLKLIQYMQAKTSSLRWVKFGSSLCISGSGKEPNPPRCFMTIKMMPKDGVATAQIVYHFICKPAVSLSCGIAWALVPRERRLESTGWPAGGQCPGPNLFRSKFIPGYVRVLAIHLLPIRLAQDFQCGTVDQRERDMSYSIRYIIQSSKLYLRRRIQALLTAHAHRTLARTHRTPWPCANFGGKIERFVSKITGFVSKIQDFGSNFARAVRARSVSAQCARAVCAGMCAQCARTVPLPAVHCADWYLLWALESISRCTDFRSRADVPRFLEKCLKLFVQLPDVTESVPSRRGGNTCGTRKPPGKHSVVLLPLFLQFVCSPLFEAGFALHGVDLRLCEELLEPRCALL